MLYRAEYSRGLRPTPDTIASIALCYSYIARIPKLENMKAADRDLTIVYEDWESSWSQATDPQFYNKDRIFIDLAKQITSEDSDLPYNPVPEVLSPPLL
jgi:hypothetical protein